MYGYLADGVVLLHLAYIGYVVLGQLAIIIAAMFRWQWGRNRWFRATHLLAIAFVVFEYAIGMTCPLTTWEQQFREKAGQTVTEGSFMGRVVHEITFLGDQFDNEESVTVMHVAAFIVVLQALMMYPPQWMNRREDEQESMGTPMLAG